MRIGKMTLVYACILSLMLGTSVILSLALASTYKASVRFSPQTYILDTDPPEFWNATIGLTHGYKGDQIDTGTIELSDPGAPSAPLSPDGTAIVKGKLLAWFDGDAVYSMIWLKITHLGLLTPGRYRLPFRITLNTLDETAFEGIGYITVIVPEPPPPPPP